MHLWEINERKLFLFLKSFSFFKSNEFKKGIGNEASKMTQNTDKQNYILKKFKMAVLKQISFI